MAVLNVLGVENWREIADFPGYEVSDYGNVRTYHPANGRGAMLKIPRLMKPTPFADKPYLRVVIRNSAGKRCTAKVHRLVLEAFTSKAPSTKHQACHNDGNPVNNHCTNLRWGFAIDNAKDRAIHGTQTRGESCGKDKLTDAQVTEILKHLPKWKWGDGKLFAERFGVSDSVISAVKSRSTWRHL